MTLVCTPQLYNKHHGKVPPRAIYIGRPSKWGNPFSHLANTLAQFKVASRDEAVEKYEGWLMLQQELLEALPRELRGMDLVCWCVPAQCHGTILLRLANC